METPTPKQIKQARERYGVDRGRAAWMVNESEADWNNWESGLLAMPGGVWKLFMLKTKQGEYERLRHI